jgi:UDP-2,4-diacetamido-2,4,6-trideoxy-beta-L-altropyranose hydrolase
MILIRVDASQAIGVGHLMRCITIAKYFKSKNISVLFITKSSYIKKWILEEEFELVSIPFNATIEDELKIIDSIVRGKQVKAMLLDINNFTSFDNLNSYDFYLQQLKKLSLFLISFEDPHNCMHSADIVIIPYLDSEKLEIRKKKNTKYLLGIKYYVLRSEFLAVSPIIIKRKVKKILITMGGCDPNNITIKVLRSLNDSGLKLHLTIVISELFKETQTDLEKVLHNYKGSYSILKNIKNMAQIMSDSDIAIINSGLTKYETVSLGLPSIVISNNEYHSVLMNDFNKYKVLINLKEVNMLGNNQINEAVILLANNFQQRKQMSVLGKSLLDGNGVKRMFSEIPTEAIY